MEASNILMNEEESLDESIYKKENWRKIKNKYILQQIFAHLNQKICFKIIKYTKKIQKKLNITQKDFIKFCEIEIEIIPTENKYYRKDPFINFNIKEEESYYHNIVMIIKMKLKKQIEII